MKNMVFVILCLWFNIEVQAQYGTEVGEYNGVKAYSNGSTSYVSDSYNTYNGTNTGMKWQCVEYVNRYYAAVYSMNIRIIGHDAEDYYPNAAARGLVQKPNGGTLAPQPGDILCSDGGQWGHIAIIREVGNGFIKVIQQNWSNNSNDNSKTLNYSVQNGNHTISGFSTSYPIQGWLSRPSSSGYIKVKTGITSPSSVVKGVPFDIAFTLKETNNQPITLESMAIAVHKPNGDILFDVEVLNNVSFSAGQERSYNKVATVYNESGIPAVTNYTVQVKGKMNNSWFVITTLSGATNPRTFTLVSPTISVSPSSKSVSSQSGTFSVSVSSNVPWTVSSNQNWLSASPTSGSNNGSVNVSYTSNTSPSLRSGTVTVRSSITGDPISSTCTVTQQVATYQINTSSNPSNGGSTSGGGTYNHGQSVTVSSQPNSGFQFLNWTENGNVVSSNSSYQFSATSNRSLTANFNQNTYQITTTSNPSNGGNTSGGGTYNHGQSVTVSAQPNSGYQFTNWTEGGNVVSSNSSYQFNATSNRSLTANFSQNTYQITTTSNPSNGGNTSGGGTYNHGQSVTVSAQPNSGFQFSNWTENGNVVSSNSSYQFGAASNRNLTANFSQNNYQVTTTSNPSNGGSTSGGGTYTHGQSVTVSAQPNSGFQFSNWTENGNVVSSNTSYQFSVASNRNLTANFSQNNYQVATTSNPSNGGSTSGGGTYTHGQSVTVSAQPNSGFQFSNWTEGGNVVSSNSSYQFTAFSNVILVANFNQNSYQVTTFSNPSNGGNTSGGGIYSHGQSVTVSAQPNTGYQFTNWTEGGNVVSGNSSYQFNATSNRSLTANFSQNTYQVTTTSNPSNGGNTSGGGTFNHGQSVTVSAQPNTGYQFTNWTEGGNVVSGNSSYQFNASSNVILIANFNQNSYQVTTSSNPSNGGNTSGGGIYSHGQSVTVNATANTGFRFKSWTEGGFEISNSPSYNFIISGNQELTANFDISTDIEELEFIESQPSNYSLIQNYPNPFNPATAIKFTILEESLVNLIVYDIKGIEVLSLLSKEALNKGTYVYNVNLAHLASGIYFYSIVATSIQNNIYYREIKKMLLLK
ncbi:MAG: hypothetical protein FMNOHCHN_03524 [Ignavibacteriaceae bacterium]|nr:hypothetical protein [Ignavibacteriaceae bacterium]